MAELLIPLPAEVSDQIKERCRDCFFARNLVAETIRQNLDPTATIDRINTECAGWSSKEEPLATLINNESEPALALSTSIDESCQHPLS